MSKRMTELFGPPDISGFQTVLMPIKWGGESLIEGQKVMLQKFQLISEYKDDARATGDTHNGTFHMTGLFIS